jgi:hypothetical protein
MKEIPKNKENKENNKNSSLPATLQPICTRKPLRASLLTTFVPHPPCQAQPSFKFSFKVKKTIPASNGCDIPTKAPLITVIESLRMSQSGDENLLAQSPGERKNSPKSRAIRLLQEQVDGLLDTVRIGDGDKRILQERLDESLHSVQNSEAELLERYRQEQLTALRQEGKNSTPHRPMTEQEERFHRKLDMHKIAMGLPPTLSPDHWEGPPLPKRSAIQDRSLECIEEESLLGINYTPADTRESRDIATAIQRSFQDLGTNGTSDHPIAEDRFPNRDYPQQDSSEIHSALAVSAAGRSRTPTVKTRATSLVTDPAWGVSLPSAPESLPTTGMPMPPITRPDGRQTYSTVRISSHLTDLDRVTERWHK